MNYSDRFILCGDYAFGLTEGGAETLAFSAKPFHRTGEFTLSSPTCFVPLRLMQNAETEEFFRIPFAPQETRATPAPLKPLEDYLKSGPMHTRPYWELHRAMRQIHAISQHVRAHGPAEQARRATHAVITTLLQRYPHAVWLLSQSRHPYYVAPIMATAPEHWLCNREGAPPAPLPRRPDILYGTTPDEFEWMFIEQITRFSYIQLGISSELLSDESLWRDSTDYRNNRAGIMEEAIRRLGSFATASADTPEAMATMLEQQLEKLLATPQQGQSSYDGDALNRHHDADAIATLHLLRKRLESLAAAPTREVYASTSPAVEILALFTPRMAKAYSDGFLPVLRQAMQTAGLPAEKL